MSVHLLVHLLVRNAFVSAGRDERANDLFREYKLVFVMTVGTTFLVTKTHMEKDLVKP